jgi:hypothetical protein
MKCALNRLPERQQICFAQKLRSRFSFTHGFSRVIGACQKIWGNGLIRRRKDANFANLVTR